MILLIESKLSLEELTLTTQKSLGEINIDHINIEFRDSINRGGAYAIIHTALGSFYLMSNNEETMYEGTEKFNYIITHENRDDDENGLSLLSLEKHLTIKKDILCIEQYS